MIHPKEWEYGDLFLYLQHIGFFDENLEMGDCEYLKEEMLELVISDLINNKELE